MHAPVLT